MLIAVNRREAESRAACVSDSTEQSQRIRLRLVFFKRNLNKTKTNKQEKKKGFNH